MSDALERRAKFRELIGKIDLYSHKKWEVVLDTIDVHILEMEDVLFHHNSAVMMPENPEGVSSQDGAGETSSSTKQDQEKITGVKALALVFKQFEFNPGQKIIVAGHTDTSGEAKYNFELSELRANNIVYLLVGDRKKWAKICYKKHKVEDYQQIMKYLWVTRGWPCDPGKIDDKWGDNTKLATDKFIEAYNAEYADKHSTKPLSPKLTGKVDRDSKHRWPETLWQAVYDLYDEDLRSVLGVSALTMANLRENTLKFVDDKKKIVGCGESFPVDQAERKNYRSQANRRVVILFFDKDEAPEMNCPKTTKRIHKEVECPLWHNWHFTPLYIDPNDLYAVVYHLKFTYYDRVKKATTPVPEGLKILAFENGTDELNTSCRYKDGIYSLKVQFKTPLDDKNRKRLHFEIKTTNQWVYTKDKDSRPKIVTKTPDEIKDLNKPENAGKRIKYYDLPVHWSSRNYWTGYDGDPKKADRFERVFGTIKKYKPFGSALTEPGKPLAFSFDDIVLVTSAGSQYVYDRNGNSTARYRKGEPKDLSDKSRVRILYADDQDESKLKVYSTEPVGDNPSRADIKKDYTGSLMRFRKDADNVYRNLILNPPGGARVVIFCGEFYDVTCKRSTRDTSFRSEQGHVIGARAAVHNDSDVHYHKRVECDGNAWRTAPLTIMPSPAIGDFGLHYLHGGGVKDGKLNSYLVVYWSSFIMKDTKPTTGPQAVGKKTPATAAQVNEFKDIGMYNCMLHWNKKEYKFEEHGVEADNAKHIILPFFMFEAFEEFSLVPPAPAIDYRRNTNNLVTHPNFTTSLRNSRGGVPYSLSFITEENKGSWVRSGRSTNPPFSIVSLRIKTREDDNARFTGFPFDEFNDPTEYGCLAMAHELGHTTGQIDDYQDDATDSTDPDDTVSHDVPNYGQFGVKSNGRRVYDDNRQFNDRVLSSEAWPILHDNKTMMDKNGPIRMRHDWRFTHWLNEGGKDHGSDEKPLEKFLKNDQFEIVYYHPDENNPMRYFRSTAEKKNPWAFSHGGTIQVSQANNDRPMQVYFYQKPDETRRRNNTDFKGVLVVRPFFMVRYRSRNTWTEDEMKNWTYQLYRRFTTAWNYFPGKYMLSDGSGNGLDPVILRFLPGFDFYRGANPPHNHYNYRLTVRKGNNDWNQNGTRIRMGDSGAKTRKLFYHIFNKPQNSVGFAVADFSFISRWFNATVVPGGGFTVRAL